MTSTSNKPAKITPKILTEQIRFAFNAFPITVSVLLIVNVVIAYLGWKEVSETTAIYWFIASFLIVALRLGLYYAYKAASGKGEEIKPQLWQALFVIMALLSASSISFAVFLFFKGLPLHSQTLFTLLIMGIASGALPTMAISQKAYAVYITLIIAPLTFFYLSNDATPVKLLGLLSLMYLIMMILTSILFKRFMLDSLIYRYRSEQLADRLQTANKRLSSANQDLQRISTIDELTGTYNRRYFNQRLEEVWADHLREGHTMATLMIDVDFFKMYNDNFGHLQGDHCLKRIAEEIVGVIRRPRDFVARFGGEEFIMLLPNTSVPGAKQLANRIHQRVLQLAMPHKRPDEINQVSVSIGGTVIQPSNDNNIEMFLQKVDQALYQAKSTGRNRTVLI